MQANCLAVSLKKPIAPGGTSVLNIRYEGFLFGYAETGMLYVKDRIDEKFTIIRMDCLAYPTIGYPSWKVNQEAGQDSFSYRLAVSVPEPLVAVNGGRAIGSDRGEGWIRYRFENIRPAWRIDIAIADYGLLQKPEGKLKVFHFAEDLEGARRILETMSKSGTALEHLKFRFHSSDKFSSCYNTAVLS